MTDTPRTDAAEIDMSGHGVTIVTKFVQADFARKLEQEHNAMVALADRLAEALENATSWNYAKPALEAWKEARRGTD